jgi:hypothetical protein
MFSYLHSFAWAHQLSGFALDTAFTIISPNERVSHTIAGTNASPMNSLIVKLSSLSQPSRLDPATKRNVKSGENIAYTQSFMALTSNIATSARVRIPNTINMIAAIIP